MPPRKSNVSTTTNGGDEAASSPPHQKAQKDSAGIEDLTLPRSIVGRLAKGILPPNTNIGKDALLALHKSATVFVSYIASTANENAMSAGKKTIMPPDVVQALKDGDFAEFLPRLEAELKKYNDVQCDKRNSYRRRVKAEKAAAQVEVDGEPSTADEPAGGSPAESNGVTNGHVGADGHDRPTKKVKGENGEALYGNGPGVVEDTDAEATDGEDASDHYSDGEGDEDAEDDGEDDGGAVDANDNEDDEEEEEEDDDDDEDDEEEDEEGEDDDEDVHAQLRDEALDGDESD